MTIHSTRETFFSFSYSISDNLEAEANLLDSIDLLSALRLESFFLNSIANNYKTTKRCDVNIALNSIKPKRVELLPESVCSYTKQ
jgi:hypothetical protein